MRRFGHAGAGEGGRCIDARRDVQDHRRLQRLPRRLGKQGFWLSPKANGAGEWIGYDVEEEHNKLVPEDTYTNGSSTTSYTGIAEVEPGVLLLAYDKLGSGGAVAIQSVYAVRITVTP